MALPVKTPLSDADRLIWEGRLLEAQTAYHKLMTGEAVAAFTDQNGERASFAKIDAGRLADYIADMIALLGTPVTVANARVPRPLRYIFGG
jgi:hypothetical protein